MIGDDPQPGPVTLSTYEAAANLYAQRTQRESTPVWQRFLDDFTVKVGSGSVLELGSGPGWHAVELEARGLTVERTDAVGAFIEMMRADGYEARKLDIVDDDFGGPFDGVFANAVLLHLTSQEFAMAVEKAAHALRDGGVLAFTVKEGNGNAWSHDKLDLPRYFEYWREHEIRDVLDPTVWSAVSIATEGGLGNQSWLIVTAERSGRHDPDRRTT